jgi:hypothetical protein
VHNLLGDRGPVIATVLVLARHFDIPVLCMTGTPHEEIKEALRGFAGQGDFLELETRELPRVSRFVAGAPSLHPHDCEAHGLLRLV